VPDEAQEGFVQERFRHKNVISPMSGVKAYFPSPQRRRRNAMKTVLVVAATLGLSASAAFAECAWHNKVNAEAKVDKTITTASVTTTGKQSRLPAEEGKIILEEQTDAAVAE
jgi:hypothetical protein